MDHHHSGGDGGMPMCRYNSNKMKYRVINKIGEERERIVRLTDKTYLVKDSLLALTQIHLHTTPVVYIYKERREEKILQTIAPCRLLNKDHLLLVRYAGPFDYRA